MVFTAATIWQSPHVVDEYDKYQERRSAESALNRERIANEAQTAARLKQERLDAFDAAHPNLRTFATLSDGVNVAVPFTQEFDNEQVPAFEGSNSTTRIRQLTLPKHGECSTHVIEIPEKGLLQASRTGNPQEYIFAKQDSIGNLLSICDIKVDPEAETSEADKQPGVLFIQLATAK